MDEHKKYLADRLLSEEQPVTYRLLSRALNVHVNTAKEMLFDFHNQQNALRPNSIHATYLIYGTKPAPEAQGNGDVEMSGSMPDHDSSSEDAPATTITLAREESLKDVLAEYDEVTSIHVYSLAPHPLKDLAMLSDVARSVAEYAAKEDLLATSKTYGTIHNPQARRRNLKAGRTVPPASTATSIKQEVKPAKPTPATKVKQEVKQETPTATSSRESTPASSTSKTAPAPTLKRGNSGGGIMQSFAKSKPPKPKPAAAKEEDTSMALSDDGEADDMDIVPSKARAVDTESARASRKQRQEELRRMMEDDDDEEEEKKEDAEDEEMEDAPEPEPEPEPQPEPKVDNEPTEVISSSGDGRRRGKRRVMKKKRTLDDQGYMVTIQEAGWESFSEDEVAPPAKKVATPSSTQSSQGTTAKAKKPAGKGGQGSIMSFFAKKG